MILWNSKYVFSLWKMFQWGYMIIDKWGFKVFLNTNVRQMLGCLRNLMLQTLNPSQVKSVGVWITMSRKWEQTTTKNQSQDFFFQRLANHTLFFCMDFSNLAAFSFLLVHLRMIYEISEIWLKMKYLLGN